MTINDIFSYHQDTRKYSEAKSWLQSNNLLTKEVRRMCNELALLLTPSTANPPPIMLSCGGKGDEAWYVPRPHRNETPKGFESRLRAWINLFMAYNTRHDASGWHTPTHFKIVIPPDDDE